MTEVDRIASGADAALKLLFPGGVPGWVHVAEGALHRFTELEVESESRRRLRFVLLRGGRARPPERCRAPAA